ncbi:MAG: DUF4416 family protein [Planctomycetes bacterium]|nr:DUF4416 family protein [Planctomycetota bacterium]
MGAVRTHRPVLMLVAAFSRHPEALDWGRARIESRWGPIRLESERFAFGESTYYERDMGPDLTKVFWALERLADPGELPARKVRTNLWERELAESGRFAEPRPLNLDPGYVTEAKLVLATTKDRDHRLYLAEGIFGECTLHYSGGRWQPRDWTYPDYRRSDYHQFLDACRRDLRGRRLAEPGFPTP